MELLQHKISGLAHIIFEVNQVVTSYGLFRIHGQGDSIKQLNDAVPGFFRGKIKASVHNGKMLVRVERDLTEGQGVLAVEVVIGPDFAKVGLKDGKGCVALYVVEKHYPGCEHCELLPPDVQPELREVLVGVLTPA